jgi:hypothetical protein
MIADDDSPHCLEESEVGLGIGKPVEEQLV